MATVTKKPAPLTLNCEDDDVASPISWRFSNELAKICTSVKWLLLHKTACSITQTRVGKHLKYVIDNCVYKFTSTCHSSWIGRTKRSCRRYFEHVPKAFLQKRTTLNSAITKNLLDIGYQVGTVQCFNVINKHTSSSLLVSWSQCYQVSETWFICTRGDSC